MGQSLCCCNSERVSLSPILAHSFFRRNRAFPGCLSTAIPRVPLGRLTRASVFARPSPHSTCSLRDLRMRCAGPSTEFNRRRICTAGNRRSMRLLTAAALSALHYAAPSHFRGKVVTAVRFEPPARAAADQKRFAITDPEPAITPVIMLYASGARRVRTGHRNISEWGTRPTKNHLQTGQRLGFGRITRRRGSR